VLLVGLGRATRLLKFHAGLSKSYSAEVVLGTATTTLDAAGEVTGRWDQRHVTWADAQRAAAELTGTIWQVPPMVSAIKVGGRRLHQLAREGLEIDRAARQVTVTRFDVVALTAGEGDAGPVLSVEVACSAGTYVRVLAADLGAALGGGAFLRRLRRTAVGPWTEAMAIPLDSLGPEAVIAPATSLPWLQAVVVDSQRAREAANGRVLDREALGGAAGDGPWRVVDADGALLAIYQPHREALVKPIVVMPPPS
jgi:tRNA pseudouridine55 synthase